MAARRKPRSLPSRDRWIRATTRVETGIKHADALLEERFREHVSATGDLIQRRQRSLPQRHVTIGEPLLAECADELHDFFHSRPVDAPRVGDRDGRRLRRRAAAGDPRERSDRHARSDRSGRSADYGGQAAERAPLLHPREQTAAGPRRASARRQRGLGARRRGPARPRALCRAYELQRHAALSQAGRRKLHAVARHAFRRARQREHELRRDGVPAADSHRQCPR